LSGRQQGRCLSRYGQYCFHSVANPTYIVGKTDSLTGKMILIALANGTDGCSVLRDSVKVRIATPVRPAFSVLNACAEQQALFSDTTHVKTGEVVARRWNFGDNTSSQIKDPMHAFSYNIPYNVVLTLTTAEGCKDSLTKEVVVRPSPVAGFKVPLDNLQAGESIVLQDLSKGATQWAWDFGDSTAIAAIQQPVHVYLKGGVYTLTQVVSNDFNCKDTASLDIIIKSNSILPPKLPNAFSPNNDGNNDVFLVRGGPFKSVEFRVYNVWGELIFETRDPNGGWDGKWNGVSQPLGVYVYTVTAVTIDDKTYSRSGDVTLIK
jgi:gliding motility-associated-like protein